ncbi:MAG: energy transducer TonB [Hafnia sp.]|uniref:TonB family protein n=1 Tax=Hafnia paralvei TaxID=546367 RepID=UPI000DF16E52|nr:energy transducer TonB [Hafnia paralvei]MBU2672706.1 energy transducer TonB [Hafnia paralvei]RDA62886.1 energy transducer TonB [Hafnia paralvei]RDA64401.1 energy transducer TonB [Hafnia paralvei]RDA65117.1 energy transducer TonB [Hafnia paralvei]RDA75886.1 energy transducer TonB [Hafnia paralvei]
MMDILYSTQPKWGRWFVFTLTLHGLILLALVWRNADAYQPYQPPPAVMLQWSEAIEAPASPLPLPIGIAQQQQSAAAEEKQQAEDKAQPKLALAKDAKIEVAKQKKSTEGEKKKPRPVRKIKDQTSDASQAAVASNAAPQANTLSSRIAAPFNSDASRHNSEKVTWESLVKGHLNRYKKYPTDARRRARTGQAIVTFTVNASGRVQGNQLHTSSGTISLDREALAVLDRAQPLPKPPAEILSDGRYSVTMPINFDLNELRQP